MPRHVVIMWLLAGGGTLIGATLTYFATRPRLAPAGIRLWSGWRHIRFAIPAVFSSRHGQSSLKRRGFVSNSSITSTGSSAFDEYRNSQIAKLETEEREFGDYLQTLRDARDRDEFEKFVKEARSGGRNQAPATIENE